jgi:hypothetical protein
LDYFRLEPPHLQLDDPIVENVATCPDIIELETVEKPKRNNHSKLYNGRRSEIVEFCKVNTPAKTLAQYGHLGLKKQTLSDWMNREKIGKPIGVVNTRGRKEVVPKELRLELRATISEIREAGQEVHLQTIVNHMEAIIIQNPGQFNVKIDTHWARRWAIKNGYANRRATKAKLTKEFTEETRNEFLMKVALTVSDNMIDKRLVVVFDETGINLCPTAKTTFNIKGEKQVILSMLGDKRQYTL